MLLRASALAALILLAALPAWADESAAALRASFDASWYGRGGVRDEYAALSTLERAAALGAPWARLVQAMRLEEAEDASGAAEAYGKLAAEGNCQAQLRLAHGYDRGGWVEKNRAQALFWALVAAKAGGDAQRNEGHPLFSERFHYGDCATEAFFLKGELASSLDEGIRAKAQAAADAWRPGQMPDRLAAAETGPARGAAAGAVLSPSKGMPAWHPLAAGDRQASAHGKLAPEDVFATAAKAVWVVVAARSDTDLRARKGRLGSAVAVGGHTLLTNCHVVAEMPVLYIEKNGKVLPAQLTAADEASDRCLLAVAGSPLAAAAGLRGWDNLKVGETVYSIGAPKGLEATLGQGLVSGLRTIKGTRYVQTSAPVSPGSSGGGLFDAAGNLIGITTFQFREGQGLNFAIAADDYFR
jgi:hypothetical protein